MLNFLFKIATAIRKSFWFIFRPTTVGVKVIAESHSKVLLIKNRYDKYWYLPGGKVKSGETAMEGAVREVREECGVNLKDLKILGVYSNFIEYKNGHIILMRANFDEQHLKAGLEIEQLSLFDPKFLPEKTSLATKRRLEEYQAGIILNGKW